MVGTSVVTLFLALTASAPAQTTRPTTGAAATVAATRAGAPQASSKGAVGDVRFTTLQGYDYLHTSSTQPFRAAMGAGWAQMGQVMGGLKSATQIAGAPVLTIYDEPAGDGAVAADPNRKVKVDVGFPVTVGAGPAPAGALKLTKVPAERCAVVLYTGPMRGVPAAYMKLATEIMDSGNTPTGTSRMRIFYWEEEDSPNNVIMVQMGVQ
jgi:effector-binding domain-containing protein